MQLTTRFSLAVAVLMVMSFAQAMDISFTDVAGDVGLSYAGQTFGHSWGDFDRDGFVDVYVSNHGRDTRIYRNVNGQMFQDMNGQVTGDLTGDVHGGAWGDFDNDGDRDLLFVVGSVGGIGSAPNRLLVYEDGAFVDRAAEFGLDNPLSRGRMVTWLDWNMDGLLDVGFANWPRPDDQAPTSIYTRQGVDAGFVFDNDNLNFTTNLSNSFLGLVQVNIQPEPAMLVHTVFGFPEGFYNISQAPFFSIEQATGLPNVASVGDFQADDFDGNLDQELFFVRHVDFNEVELVSSTDLRARVFGQSFGELSFTFEAEGPIEVTVGPDFNVARTAINIGPTEIAPDDYTFILDPTDESVIGTALHLLTVSQLYIHFDELEQHWVFAITNRLRANVHVVAQNPITNVQTLGFTSDQGDLTAVKFNQSPQGYESFPFAFGLQNEYSCRSIATADFDNDMDLDVYMGCSSGAVNRTNVLLENDGTGSFTEVPNSAGAAGTIEGRTDVVTVADYNNDGFMDILVANGMGDLPFATGETELFENSADNGNNWIHVDLEGVTVNRDAVGAWVEITAGGKTQSMLQDNGTKRFAQDDQRMHFGLADNSTVDQIFIRWPGGQEQTVGPFAANQIVHVYQNVDSDGDGVFDHLDNCRALANPQQLDPDADGFGNRCDPDLNNDGVVNFIDVQQFQASFLTTDVPADFSGDGSVNFVDLAILSSFFLQAPGPGAFGQD
ncbi:MAG: FG-GAP-like repeat-containing protein [Pseudomonadota bacterium]